MYYFIHVPKVAGCAFYTILEEHPDKISYSGHSRAVNSNSIAFVRNPYDRLVSAYFYFMNNKILATELQEYKEIAQSYNNFTDFVLNISVDNLMEKMIHLKPMSYWVCDDSSKLIVEKIFKIEETNSINDFLRGIGIDREFPRIKINTSEHKHYTEYLNPEVVAEINKLYSLDFELFNYEKL